MGSCAMRSDKSSKDDDDELFDDEVASSTISDEDNDDPFETVESPREEDVDDDGDVAFIL